MGTCRIHIDLNKGVINVEGDESFVMEQFEKLKAILLESKETKTKPVAVKRAQPKLSRKSLIKKELDLEASGNTPSLLEFYDKAHHPTFMARSLLFLYYLKNIKTHEKISTAHIETCYNTVKAAMPTSLYQNVIVAGGKKKLIDTTDTKDLKLTPAGIEEVEKVLLAPEKRVIKKKVQKRGEKKKPGPKKKTNLKK